MKSEQIAVSLAGVINVTPEAVLSVSTFYDNLNKTNQKIFEVCTILFIKVISVILTYFLVLVQFEMPASNSSFVSRNDTVL